MWRLPSLLALLAGLSCGTALAGEPILGTFAIDPVRLVRDGQQSVGRAELTLEHANFRYLFSSEESRDVFLADPVEYEIQLGGGCARMGALSGTGRTDSFTVHEGRLYIFASEECRSTFLRDPSKVLEPLDESDMEATSASRVRGRELIELAVD